MKLLPSDSSAKLSHFPKQPFGASVPSHTSCVCRLITHFFGPRRVARLGKSGILCVGGRVQSLHTRCKPREDRDECAPRTRHTSCSEEWSTVWMTMVVSLKIFEIKRVF